MAAGGTDEEGKRKYRLLDIFGDWCDQVTDLIRWVPTPVPDTRITVTAAWAPAWQPSPVQHAEALAAAVAPCSLRMLSCTAAQLLSDALSCSSHRRIHVCLLRGSAAKPPRCQLQNLVH